MININLLPWREKRKQEIKQQTIIALLLSLLLGVVVIFITDITKNMDLNQQLSRNKFLQISVSQLSNRIAELDKLKNEKEKIIKELDLAHNLITNKYSCVNAFNQMVLIIPDDTFLKKMMLIKNELSIVGLARFNENISDIMRNLNEAEFFDKPVLTSVKKITYNEEGWNEFNLKVNYKNI